MIAVRDLRKRFGALEVLKGISLSVARGEVAAVIGESGSGKSTLLRCINGLEAFEAGSVDVGDCRLAPRADARRDAALLRKIRRRVGFVFQQFNLFPHMTAIENVREPLVHALGLSREEANTRAADLLTQVGLKDHLAKHPAQLSGGQQQRVAIARSLINHPPLLFADEPTGNLDSRTSEEVLAMFQQLNERDGITIILVTHDAGVAHGDALLVKIDMLSAL